MTYEEAIKSGKPFNRKKYEDGWYVVDGRGLITHLNDMSIRNPRFTEEDKRSTDWYIKTDHAGILKHTIRDRISIRISSIYYEIYRLAVPKDLKKLRKIAKNTLIWGFYVIIGVGLIWLIGYMVGIIIGRLIQLL